MGGGGSLTGQCKLYSDMGLTCVGFAVNAVQKVDAEGDPHNRTTPKSLDWSVFLRQKGSE